MSVEPQETPAVIRTERRPGVVRLVLDRAEEGNALDLQMARGILAALRAAEADPDGHVLTLTGTGRFFCGGGDVRGIAGHPPEQRPAYLAELADAAHEVALALVTTRLLVVAGVNGAAAGAGLGLVLNADWVLAAEEATLLAAYAGIGLTPDTGVSYLLPRIVGHPRAVELTLGGRRLSGDEAVAWGLANASAPAAVFDAELTLAEDAFIQGAVQTLAPTKRLLRAGMIEGYAAHLRDESAEIAALAAHPDTVRRVNRFAGRRRTPGPRSGMARLAETPIQRRKATMGTAVSTLQDVPLTPNDGTETTFGEAFGGQVVLVVNVASKCGFTPQYAGLEELYTSHRGQGLVVLGVPCNQFKEQEPGTDAEIGQFCQANYGVTFPLARKADVNGPEAHPLYRQLTAYPTGEVQDVTWNFEKFLVGRDGRILGRFRSAVEPLSGELVDAVRTAL